MIHEMHLAADCIAVRGDDVAQFTAGIVVGYYPNDPEPIRMTIRLSKTHFFEFGLSRKNTFKIIIFLLSAIMKKELITDEVRRAAAEHTKTTGNQPISTEVLQKSAFAAGAEWMLRKMTGDKKATVMPVK